MTKFPLREYRNEPSLDWPIKICDCGHPDYLHNRKDLELRENENDDRTDCKTCMCPYFNPTMTTTQREFFKVRYNHE